MFNVKDEVELLLVNSMSEALYKNVMELLYGAEENLEDENYFLESYKKLNFD